MRRRIAIGIVWAGMSSIGVNLAKADAPTYQKDIAPILQKNCQDCHRTGQVAPFSLLTYDQARKRAADLAQVAEERSMPPWPASTTFGGPFRDQRVLSDADIARLRAWVEAGCPEGDAKDAPPPREFSTDWPLGKPDLILTMPVNYELAAEGSDEFRVFVLKTDFPEERWIRAVDFKPGNRKVVHHIIAGIDASGKARKLDAKDEKPGYEAVGGFGDVDLRGFLPIWTPGAVPRFQPAGTGYVLPPKADLLIQMHYHKSGKPESDATQVGLYLSDKPLPKQVRTRFIFPDIPKEKSAATKKKMESIMARRGRPTHDDIYSDIVIIPAGEARYTIKGSSRPGSSMMNRPIDRDILVTSVMPHMHWLGKDFTFTAVLPDEAKTRIPLIKIDHWNFNWQGTYAFEKPIFLPKGSYVEMEAHFDNSDTNPANPTHPPKVVTWGEETTNEMCIGIFEFVAAEGADAPASKPASISEKP